jgi:tRNA A-37 threonylcarbamoyl transferase component Bud32
LFTVKPDSVRIEPGTRVGPFAVERRLAQSATTARFIARADERDRRLVLKVLSAEILPDAARPRFLRDMRWLSSVEHRNVAHVMAAGEKDGTTWIAMQYVAGSDLARIVAERGPLAPEVAVGYALQVAEGLAAIHATGMVHGSLRPSKLLVAPDGCVVVVDAGLPGKTVEAYRAPEQVEGAAVDVRSDVWAFGCVLYEMLTGEPPFGRSPPAGLKAVVRGEPTFPRTLPTSLQHLISDCLRKSPFARPASGRELCVVLRDAGERLDVDTSNRGPSTRPPPPQRGSVPPLPSNGSRYPAMRGRIKGTALRAGLTWFLDAYGASAAARVGDFASPELHATLRFDEAALGVMPSGWYDTQLVGELLVTMEQAAFPPDSDAFLARLAEAIARDNVNGVYRSLFKLVASPALLEANAQRVWRTYVDEGILTVHCPSVGSFEARVRGWSRHHPAVCRLMRPMLEHLLRSIGYTALVVERTECVAEGGSQCSFDGSWIP